MHFVHCDILHTEKNGKTNLANLINVDNFPYTYISQGILYTPVEILAEFVEHVIFQIKGPGFETTSFMLQFFGQLIARVYLMQFTSLLCGSQAIILKRIVSYMHIQIIATVNLLFVSTRTHTF